MDISKQKEVLTSAKEKMQKAMLHLEEELKTYRAGKANPAVFNNVMVDYFGNPTPVPQVASITTPDAKTMLIQPWDKKNDSCYRKGNHGCKHRFYTSE